MLLGAGLTSGVATADDHVESTLNVEPLMTLGEPAGRWILRPGGTGASDQFLCTVVFRVLAAPEEEEGFEIVEGVPRGLAYVPNSATGPGADIAVSTDGGETFVDETGKPADAGRVTHVRWTLRGPLAMGMTGRVSFRGEIERGPSSPVADQ